MKNQEDFEPKTQEEISEEITSEPVEESAAPAADETAVESAEVPADDSPESLSEEPADESAPPADDDAEDGEDAADAKDSSDDEAAPADEEGATPDAEVEGKKKKPFILQTPVIISCGIVLLALIGYLIFSVFFFCSPLNTIWMLDDSGSIYYFEFTDDGDFTTTRGTIQESIPYSLETVDGADAITFHYPDGDSTLSYTITGARALGNQEMTLFNSTGTYTRTLVQVKEIDSPLELPDSFTPDEALLGEWELDFSDTKLSVTFNADGSMIYRTDNSMYHYSQVYTGTYTLSDGHVNFTYYSVEPIVEALDYEVKGDTLYFLSMPFTRAGASATPDEG